MASAYAELTIPILGNKWSAPGARLLEIVLQERYDQYSDFGSAAKPKFLLLYKPFDDLTLRTTYSEGYRAPSLPELDSGSFIEQAALVDPKTADTTLTFGINNIFDTNPPFADEGYGFDPATANAFGRYFYMEVEKKF
jgi:iron complex outermembrane recepter protein